MVSLTEWASLQHPPPPQLQCEWTLPHLVPSPSQILNPPLLHAFVSLPSLHAHVTPSLCAQVQCVLCGVCVHVQR